MPERTTRREKHKQATYDEIKQVARTLMKESGTAGLSLRAIARAMEMSSASLYYYYPSIGDLITALIVDAFTALTDTLQKEALAGEGTFAERGMRVALAYRTWALTHPTDFQLIYGNPIPGYQQPTDITYPPARRGFALLAGLIANAVASGELVPSAEYTHLPPGLDQSLTELMQIEGHDYPAVALYLAASIWGRMHGIVMLELFHLIQPVIRDTEVFYKHEVYTLFKQIGLKEGLSDEDSRD